MSLAQTAAESVATDSAAEIAEQLVATIGRYSKVVVAFSGGVDSAVVAKAAAIAKQSDASAIIATGPALGRTELESAHQTADSIGIALYEVAANELADSDYVANAGRRCYFCKSRLYLAAKEFAKNREIAVILNGANSDDLGDYRPGLEAAAEFGVVSPLADLGINKATVRKIATFWDLDVAEKPASPCLASRIAPGVEVTAERLARIEAAEAVIRGLLGTAEIRVRVEEGELARIEVPAEDLLRATEMLITAGVVEKFAALGFRATTLDLQGFRSGNLNSLVELAAGPAESAAQKLKQSHSAETR